MSFSYAQNAHATSTSTSSLSATFGSSVAVGDLLVVGAGALNAASGVHPFIAISDNKGNSWFRVIARVFTQGAGLGQTITIFATIVTVGGTGLQVTITPSISAYMNLSVDEYSFTDSGTIWVYASSQSFQTSGAGSTSAGTLDLNGSSSNLCYGMSTFTDGAQGQAWSAAGVTNLRYSVPFVSNTSAGAATGDVLNPAGSTATVSFTSGAGTAESLAAVFTFSPTTGPLQYLSTFFSNDNSLCVCTNSSCGSMWQAVPGQGYEALYTPTGSDVVRDPSRILKIGSTYFVAHTNRSGTATNTITIASSTDLYHWSFLTHVDFSSVVGSGGLEAVVGPEFLLDSNGDIYLFCAGGSTYFTSISNNSVFAVKATDLTGLTTWGLPVTVGGFSSGPYLDPFPILDSSTYYLYYNSGIFVSRASSSTPTGTYTGIAGSFPSSVESSCLVNLGGSNWRIFLDAQGNGESTEDTSGGLTGTFATSVAQRPNLMAGQSVSNGFLMPLPSSRAAYAAALLPAI